MTQQLVGIPKNLLVYKPQQKTTALCWQVNLDTNPTLDLLDFEVELDVVVDFSSINKKVYTKNNVVNYQNGTFFKAFVIDDPLLFETQKYYWRVRVNSTDYISEWSDYQQNNISNYLDNMEYNLPTRIKVSNSNNEIVIQKTRKEDVAMFDTYPPSSTEVDGIYERYTKEDFLNLLEIDYGITDNINVYVGPYEFDINKITWYDDTETSENLLPDNYVYTKTGNTNIKRIIEMYMRLIGVFKDEVVQVANNFNYKKTQDKDLYDMLGILLTYTRNIEEPFITYKYELLNLWQAFLHQGTVEAFNIVFETFYGVKPTIEILKDKIEETWYLYENNDSDVERYYLYQQLQLLSIDGTTSTSLDIKIGDAFYNGNTNKIIVATKESTTGNWSNAYEEEPNEMTTYQVMEQQNLVSYQYIAASNGFYEGTPNIENIPYLYTNQYLAHNLVLTINNIYNIQLDKKILMGILNNLKPLNVNIILNINNDIN